MTTVDLTNCDREPIHIPGSIQPHGCMLVCDEAAVTIRRHSRNAAAFLGLAEQDLLGRKLEDVIGGTPVHELRNALARSPQSSRPGLMPNVELPKSLRSFDISVHRFRGNAIIEFEPAAAEGTSSPLEFARTLVGRLSNTATPGQLIAGAARLLRAVLQYDRVMIYQFAADGSGQVVSEAKRADLESFMGQHFPASDIPQQARQLYLLNTIRLVSNASGEHSVIEPVLDAAGEPLDLSYAHLRSVSPIHCEYLRNMGVSASMSVSIIIDGALWGLIACHHYSPRAMSMNQRIAAEIFGEFFALQLGMLGQKEKSEAGDRARNFLGVLLASSSHSTNVAEFLRAHLGEFRQLMTCDGLGLLIDGVWSHDGLVPPDAFVPELAAFIGSTTSGKIWTTGHLSEVLPQARAFSAAVSGVLAIPLSQLPRDYLFFFRRELVQTIEWGGDPKKTYASGPLGDRLTPRQSFAVWKQTVENRSRPWTRIERELAESARSALVEVVLRHGELLAEEREKADIRQKVLNQELNHRVKNILSLIRSIITHPSREARDIETYVETIRGRIEALAYAHDQAMQASGGGILRDLLDAELGPYLAGGERIAMAGPPAALDTRAFSVLALVIHELATNAAKYGALSRDCGRLSVTWRREANGECAIVWRETGGPLVSTPTRIGFGSALVSRSIPFDLGGRSDVAFDPAGVVASLTIPARFVSWLAQEAAGQMAAGQHSGLTAAQPLLGKSVLLVEDQFLIVMDAEDMLAMLGARSVVVCSSVKEAMVALDRSLPDLAMLDINLGSENSMPVARRLRAEGVPFVFATGYDEGMLLADDAIDAPIVRKPYREQVIAAALQQAVSARVG
jgi:light-regulated signal transduction histidine kinase (bacteriophytochrome)/CheY-like chemotaxis protein